MDLDAQRQRKVNVPPLGRIKLMARLSASPAVSWILNERRPAARGVGLGVLGGVGWMLGTIFLVLGLGGGSSAPFSDGTLTPYFIGVSVAIMLAWLLWIASKRRFQPKALTPTVVRQGAIMGVIYGATLAGTISLAALV